MAGISVSETAHFAAVGRVASNWSLLELDIDGFAWELAGIDSEIGACFTAQVSGSARKFDALLALSEHLGVPAPVVSKLRKLAKTDAMALAEKRNRVVHDPWLIIRHGHGGRLEVTARRTVRTEIVTVPTSNVLELAQEIDALRLKLGVLARAALKALADQGHCLSLKFPGPRHSSDR
jgi:hypothetical protein